MGVDEVLDSLDEADVFLILVDRDNFRDTADMLAQEMIDRGYEGIYFTADRTFEEVRECVAYRGADTDCLQILDIVSSSRGVKREDERTAFIDSPTAFNDVNVTFTDLYNRLEGDKTFVILDSFTSYILYGELRMIGNFVKRLTDKTRNRDGKFFILAMADQLDEEVVDRFMTFCDKKVDLAERD